MFNAPSRLIVAAALAAMLASCGGSEKTSESQDIYNQAEEAFGRGDLATATALLDSLDAIAEPSSAQTNQLRRKSMALRPRVVEQMTLREISTADSLVAANTALHDQLAPTMKWVKTPGMIEGYHVAATAYNPSFLNSTGLEARVSEIGQFYLVSSMNPGSIKHHSATLRIGAEEANVGPVAYDGELNYRINGSEVVTYSPEMSDTLGRFAADHPGASAVLVLSGDKGNKTLKLSPKQTAAIADAYRFSRATIDARDAAARREHLNRQLDLARSQIARTLPAE